MTNSKITNLTTLSDPTDAATMQQYVHTRCVKNNVGYIPNLEGNISITGFSATSSFLAGPTFQAWSIQLSESRLLMVNDQYNGLVNNPMS